MVEVLTVSLAGVIDSREVLVAAALVGTLCVVADVGTHSKLLTLVLICATPPPIHITHVSKSKHNIREKMKPGQRKLVPSHLFRPLGRKPGLQEQKESVAFTTQ